jgi:hypothetical protein
MSTTPTTGGTLFTYQAAFDGEDLSQFSYTRTLESGDFFTILDFDGLVAGSNSQPANWTFSTSLTGQTPANLNLTSFDDAAVPNLTWTYTGPTVIADTVFTGFSAVSLFSGQRLDRFAAENTETLGGTPLPRSNTSFTSVPNRVAPIPEPSEWLAMGMAGASVGGLMLRARRRNRSSVNK